jgi:signal transduction histidine kinase
MSMRRFITEHRDALLQHCLTRLRAAHPERADAELIDNLPRFFDELLRALDEDIGLPMVRAAGHTPEAASHGRQRRAAGFDITAVSSDYGLFSDAVGEVASQLGMVFEPREYQVLNACVDGSIAAALEDYWAAARDESEQRTTEMIGFLVHELRNANAAARMAFSALRESHVGVHGKTGDILDRNLDRIDYLIGNAFAGIKLRGGLTPDSEELDLLRIVRQVLQSVTVTRGIQIDFLGPVDAVVIGDEHLLISAIHNLVQNAVKYTRDNGRIEVHIHVEPTSCVVTVADECGGLPVSDPEALFRPFVRGRDRTGIGLGLAIAREAVRAHRGDIRVIDRPGIGCVFEVKLPRPTP